MVELTRALFAGVVGEVFLLGLGNGRLCEAMLQEVNGVEERPFSLLFRLPLAAALPQGIYPLSREGFAEAELFLVPVGMDGNGRYYEAVFN